MLFSNFWLLHKSPTPKLTKFDLHILKESRGQIALGFRAWKTSFPTSNNAQTVVSFVNETFNLTRLLVNGCTHTHPAYKCLATIYWSDARAFKWMVNIYGHYEMQTLKGCQLGLWSNMDVANYKEDYFILPTIYSIFRGESKICWLYIIQWPYVCIGNSWIVWKNNFRSLGFIWQIAQPHSILRGCNESDLT